MRACVRACVCTCSEENHDLTADQMKVIVEKTRGYSGADMSALCTEAAYGPLRSLQGDISAIQNSAVRPINLSDFEKGMKQVRASVSPKDLHQYEAWNKQYGSFPDDENASVANQLGKEAVAM